MSPPVSAAVEGGGVPAEDKVGVVSPTVSATAEGGGVPAEDEVGEVISDARWINTLF
jgi:hypothetical protein